MLSLIAIFVLCTYKRLALGNVQTGFDIALAYRYICTNMKRILPIVLFVCCLLAATFSIANPNRNPQTIYIEQFAGLAVEEMYRSGVPASITLAQGLLESRYGLSELAVRGNNHFGIKCHNNWNGRKMYHDDDRNNECFRVYGSPEESFRDHSDFLRYRDRYKFLFDLEPTDYKGWAHGLKKAGYATDPAYPKKLIKLIEEFDLHQYDTKPASWAYQLEDGKPADKVSKEDISERKLSKREARKAEKARRKAARNQPVERPESPNSIEQAKPLNGKQRETFHFALSRQMYSLNGVPFVLSSEGETYSSIADSYNLFQKEILKFNDLRQELTLYPGSIVYLQAKKKQAAAGLEKHIVEGYNETLWDISQRYAVKLEKLCEMNGISAEKRLSDGEVIILRK